MRTWLVPLLEGTVTYIPGWRIARYISRLPKRDRGGTDSAQYCYSVWLRHLIMAHKNGLSTCPTTVAELGPGYSLGTGLAALLVGAKRYYAFDIVKSANNSKNIEIFDELIDLFEKRENIPHRAEYAKVKPYLESYDFPRHILTDDRLNMLLMPERIESIRSALLNPNIENKHDIQISYFPNWHDSNVTEEGSIDMIFSQAVLHCVDNLTNTYENLYRWLKPGGFMSHQIDFRSCGTAREWNGHWTYGDLKWKLMRGKRTYLINRHQHSIHINLLRKLKLKIICDIKIKTASEISRKYLAPRFKDMSDDDLTTSGTFIQAVK